MTAEVQSMCQLSKKIRGPCRLMVNIKNSEENYHE